MRNIVACVGSAVFILVVASYAVSPPRKSKEPFSGYRNWYRVTQLPVVMDPQLAMLCVGPSDLAARDTRAHAVSAKSLHTDEPQPFQFSGFRVFDVYVNGVGQKAMLSQGQCHFPPGSVIVKEKFRAEDFKRKSTQLPTPELLTVMVKGSPGSNPSVGDWKFFAVDGVTQHVLPGAVAHCEKCHASQAKGDFVFRHYGKTTISDLKGGD